MKYCPYCRAELQFQDATFCHECGATLSITKKTPLPPDFSKILTQPTKTESPISKSSDESPIIAPQYNIYELGRKLEIVVEKIMQSKGYSTQSRQIISGASGTPNEIDILARKGNRTIAIECKNHSSVVGIEPVRDFNSKLNEIGLSGKGLFVAYNGLTSNAEEYAQFHHIDIMDYDKVEEQWTKISIGRTESVKGQLLTLNHALPINVSFSHATSIHLANKEFVKVSEAELIFHPYLLVQYNFSASFTTPDKQAHKISDKGTVFIDALSGRILNGRPEKGLGFLKAVKNITSTTSKKESGRLKKLISELKEKSPLSTYNLQIEEDYQCNYQKPEISDRQAIDSVIQFIIEINTTQVSYSPKSRQDDLIPQIKYFNYTPRRKDIQIYSRNIVIIPRWSIEFQSSNSTYRREVLACSGTILEDTMGFCPSHFKLGSIEFFKKTTVAVCETCGKALCHEHIRQCVICGKWLCAEHSFDCEVCNGRFCLEHEHLQCSSCNGKICFMCLTTCPVCQAKYSPKHSLRCDSCGKMTCPQCITTTGLIRKTRTCKNCK